MSVIEHPFWELKLPKGSLLLTPCPGSLKSSLEDALAQLKQQGAVAIITLVSNEELNERNLDCFGESVSDSGLEWFHIPVPDDDIPRDRFEQKWNEVLQKINEYLQGESSVAIHCMGGSGRTGLIAARLMLDQGIDAKQAISKIRELRPKAFSLSEQREYIYQFDMKGN